MNLESENGLEERCRTQDRRVVSSNPEFEVVFCDIQATYSVFSAIPTTVTSAQADSLKKSHFSSGLNVRSPLIRVLNNTKYYSPVSVDFRNHKLLMAK